MDEGYGTVSFKNKEVFNGFLLCFLGKSFEINTRNAFNLMNENLKKKIRKQRIILNKY
jgi:hypothetical protein